MNREQRIEKAEALLKRALQKCIDRNLDKDIVEFLKPELDWSQVKFGDVVTNNSNGQTGLYISHTGDDTFYVRANKYKSVQAWTEKNCTFEPNPYTEVVWHDWPEDGRKPKWVMGADKILVIHNRASRYVNARSLTWSDKRGKFAVIREKKSDE